MRRGASFAVAVLAIALGFVPVGAQLTGPRGAGGPLEQGGPVGAPEPAVAGVVALREEASPFVAFNIWVKSGSAADPRGKEGLASLTASLISGGATEQDSFVQVLERLYPLAADYGASVDKEMTNITGRVHRDNLEAFYALLRNAVLSPAFTEADFTRIKAQRMNYLERGRRYSRDEELSKELLSWMAYDETPYRHPVDGYVQSVRSITLDDVRGFYRSHYVRNNLVVGIGGGYPEGFAERVRKDLDALPEGRVQAPAVLSLRPLAGIKVLLVDKDTAASPVSFGYPIALLRNHPDFVPLLVANAYLGEHRNPFGRLYQAIRETRGMNYGNYSYIEAFPGGYATQQPRVNVARRGQLFEIWIRPISQTAPGNLHDRTLFALRAAMHEVDRLVNTGMTPDAVASAKTFLRNYVGTWGSTISRRLAYAVDDRFYGIEPPGYLQTLKAAIDSVTPEQVNGAIRRQLRADGMCVVVVTSDAAGLKAKLISGAATPITYAGEPSAEVLAEDRIIAARPIPVKESDIRILTIDEVFER
jgi:zinc protease